MRAHLSLAVPAMKRVMKAEMKMLRQMPRSDVQRRYNIGAATDWNDMMAALLADNSGLTFEPEDDADSQASTQAELPDTCIGGGQVIDPAEGGMITTVAQFQKYKEQRRKRLLHMATHHPPPPPTPATPPIETSNVEEMAITNIIIAVKDRYGHKMQFRIAKHAPLRKLMQAYGQRSRITLTPDILFVTSDDFACIQAEDTCEKLGLNDGAVILVFEVAEVVEVADV